MIILKNPGFTGGVLPIWIVYNSGTSEHVSPGGHWPVKVV